MQDPTPRSLPRAKVHHLEVHDQVRLPFLRCLELVLNGIQFRLFRAAITVVIVALAVAFLVTMVGNSLIAREVVVDIEEQTGARRQLLFWVHRLGSPLTETDLRRSLVAAVSPERAAELARWGGLSDDEVRALREVAVRESEYLQFFAGVDRRVVWSLVGGAEGGEVFRSLANPEAWAAFEKALSDSGLRLPTSAADFRTFLAEWSATARQRADVRRGYGESLRGVQAALGGRSPVDVLAAPDEGLRGLLAEHGFLLSGDELGLLQKEAANSRDTRELQQALQKTAARQRLAVRRRVAPQDVAPRHLFQEVRSEKGAEWLTAVLSEIGAPLSLSAERIREVATYNLRQMYLAAVESKTAPLAAGSGVWRLSPRLLCLLAVSLLVCVVGITNAMLMSVTERFQEIATTKCLGATDGFVMTNFLLESSLQGLAGGILGALMGGGLGFAKALATYGWIAARNVPVGPLLLLAVCATAVGVVLSALAAVYPAWVAARLAPLEAMRVE